MDVVDGGFQVWTGAYVSSADRIAVIGCVPLGYPTICVQWWKGKQMISDEVFPVIYTMDSADYWCILSVKGVAKLKYKFSISLGKVILQASLCIIIIHSTLPCR